MGIIVKFENKREKAEALQTPIDIFDPNRHGFTVTWSQQPRLK